MLNTATAEREGQEPAAVACSAAEASAASARQAGDTRPSRGRRRRRSELFPPFENSTRITSRGGIRDRRRGTATPNTAHGVRLLGRLYPFIPGVKGGFKAHELRMHVSATATMWIRMVAVGRRVFKVAAGTKNDAPEAMSFLDSFQLTAPASVGGKPPPPPPPALPAQSPSKAPQPPPPPSKPSQNDPFE